MTLSKEDLVLIKTCFEEKGWRGKRLVEEFPKKNWRRSTLNRAIKKLCVTGSIARKKGSGRRPKAKTEHNEAYVEQFVLAQGNNLSQRNMAKTLGVSRGTVQRIMRERKLSTPKKKVGSPKKTATAAKEKQKNTPLANKDKPKDTPTAKEKPKAVAVPKEMHCDRCKMFSDDDLERLKRMIFPDMTNFSLEVSCNRQNYNVNAPSCGVVVSPPDSVPHVSGFEPNASLPNYNLNTGARVYGPVGPGPHQYYLEPHQYFLEPHQ